jgi:DNA-binding MarR family transcriptional regulator
MSRAPPLARELVAHDLTGTTSTTLAVYALLRCEGPMTYRELRGATGRSQPALRQALETLRERELVESAPHPSNPRQERYRVPPSALA